MIQKLKYLIPFIPFVGIFILLFANSIPRFLIAELLYIIRIKNNVYYSNYILDNKFVFTFSAIAQAIYVLTLINLFI